MNKIELSYEMKKHGDNQDSLAKALNVSRPWLNSKLNEKKGAAFTLPEMILIKKRYNLTAARVEEIFFTKAVS